MYEARHVLLAEDDASVRDAMVELIRSWGFKVRAAEDGQRALELVEEVQPDILLLDLKMPRKNGLEVMESLKQAGFSFPIIMISGEGEVADAVRAIKLGAYDYLTKPLEPLHLKALLLNLSAHLRANAENQRLKMNLMAMGALGPLLGQSLAMRRVMAMVEQVAPSQASVVIAGESGAGKEVVARTIHRLSPRADGPYVAINCAAIPETLMESELFGHERGSFTGADARRVGAFEMAMGGTLLLDEITEMKSELQAKLLRVLEDRKIRRLGGSREIELDVRVLAASNRDLEQAVREGRLREDLYYRLNVFYIEVPPLRKRVEDIPLLASHFMRQFAAENRKNVTGIDNECLDVLKSYGWPGNVRQLRNVIERAMVMTKGPLITVHDLPPELRKQGHTDPGFWVRLGASLEEVERELIYRTIEFTGGNKARAAEILGVSLKTLYNRLERYESRGRERALSPS